MLMGCCRGVWVIGVQVMSYKAALALAVHLPCLLLSGFSGGVSYMGLGRKHHGLLPCAKHLEWLRGLYSPQQPVHGPVMWYVCVVYMWSW